MKRRSLLEPAVIVLLSTLTAAPGLTQSFNGPEAPLGYNAASGLPARRPSGEHEFRYVGTYAPDGKFRTAVEIRSNASWQQLSTTSDVPPMRLPSDERRVEDFEPPKHAVARVRKRSGMSAARDKLLTMLYGRERILRAPHYLTTDSRHRLIISDPGLPAVHVLDPGQGKSFRIVAGRGHRLLFPSGTAVDSDNNIYVADSERGRVLVYDPEGVFLRYLGAFDGQESLFHHPTSIVIDRDARRLYVLDSTRVFMLDLEGKVLARIGKLRGDKGLLEDTRDMALGSQELLVIDAAGARVRVMDLQCRLLRTLALSHAPISEDTRLTVDNDGNMYASYASASTIRVYDRDGTPLASVRGLGIRSGEFYKPTGLWIDSENRIYVADSSNARVQVFQLGRVQP